MSRLGILRQTAIEGLGTNFNAGQTKLINSLKSSETRPRREQNVTHRVWRLPDATNLNFC